MQAFKKVLICLSILIGTAGCANFNPRLDEKIDNQNGKIDEIKNNQNGVMTEIGKLKQDSTVQNSTLKDVQQGYLNVQSRMFSKENNGIQILQGDGALILIFGLGTVALVCWHYRSESKRFQKTAEIMAQQIAQHNDEHLHDKVFRAAMYTDVESDIFHLISKYSPEKN